MTTTKIGLIGCGNISEQYGSFIPNFNNMELTTCADINMDSAKAFAEKFGVTAMTVDEILASDVDVIVNLTIPAAHAEVSKKILNAGKHVYSEKPLAVSMAEGQDILQTAGKMGLRVGCAPDTFLGGTPQHVRALLDNNTIGKVTTGTAHVMSHGMEMWHPNPDFFFQPGAGPIFDLGPYYITLLIHLLGPIKSVCAMANKGTHTRTITSEPRNGEIIPVDTPTTLHAVLTFDSGAIITLSASWDVWAHTHSTPVELYGIDGSLFAPDPNWFDGDIKTAATDGKITDVQLQFHPFGVANFPVPWGVSFANWRGAGLSDMVDAIKTSRPHRCSGQMALHVLEVMESILQSAESQTFITLQTTCYRPDALSSTEAQTWLKNI